MENLQPGLIPFSPPDFQAFLRPWSKVEQGPMSDIVYWSPLMTPFFSPCLSEYSRATLFLQGQKQSRILPFSSPYQLIRNCGNELNESNAD